MYYTVEKGSGQLHYNHTIKHLDVIPHYCTPPHAPDLVSDNSEIFDSPKFNNYIDQRRLRDRECAFFYHDLLKFVCINFSLLQNHGYHFLMPTSESNVIISYTVFAASYPLNVRQQFQRVFRIQIMNQGLPDQGLPDRFKPTKKTNYRFMILQEKSIWGIFLDWLIVFVTFGFILLNSSFRANLLSNETVYDHFYYDHSKFFFLLDKTRERKIYFSLLERKDNGDVNVLLSRHEIHDM